MGFIGFGLVAVIVGTLLALNSETPQVLDSSEVFSLLLVAAGAVSVLVGIVVHVRQVIREDRRGAPD